MTVQRPRETLPDALRALALISVLVVNAMGYASAPWGPTLGVRTPADSAWAAATEGLVAALLQAKGYSMLAFVFGMALWLASRQRPAPQALQRGVVRQRRMLGLGILHGAFVYFGDILTLYALVGRRLLRRLHMPWTLLRRHLRRALAWAVIAKLLLLVMIVRYTDQPLDASDPSLGAVQSGWQFLQLNASYYAVAQVVAVIVAGPVMYLCMLGGVAAARLRLLTHRRWRPWLRGGLLRAGPPLLVLSLIVAVGSALIAPTDASRGWIDALGDLIAIPVAGCYMAGLALASRGGRARWCHALGPLGQRTLSLYVGHSMVCVALFSGIGLAIELSTAQMLLFCLVLWFFAWGLAVLSGRHRWPLEAWMARR